MEAQFCPFCFRCPVVQPVRLSNHESPTNSCSHIACTPCLMKHLQHLVHQKSVKEMIRIEQSVLSKTHRERGEGDDNHQPVLELDMERCLFIHEGGDEGFCKVQPELFDEGNNAEGDKSRRKEEEEKISVFSDEAVTWFREVIVERKFPSASTTAEREANNTMDPTPSGILQTQSPSKSTKKKKASSGGKKSISKKPEEEAEKELSPSFFLKFHFNCLHSCCICASLLSSNIMGSRRKIEGVRNTNTASCMTIAWYVPIGTTIEPSLTSPVQLLLQSWDRKKKIPRNDTPPQKKKKEVDLHPLSALMVSNDGLKEQHSSCLASGKSQLEEKEEEARESDSNGLLCGVCEEKPGVQECAECGFPLCETCQKYTHTKGKYKQHHLIPVSSSGKNKFSSLKKSKEQEEDNKYSASKQGDGSCPLHPGYKFELYCRDCHKPLCLMCGFGRAPILTTSSRGRHQSKTENKEAAVEKLKHVGTEEVDHRSHDVVPIQELLQEATRHLHSKMNRLEEYRLHFLLPLSQFQCQFTSVEMEKEKEHMKKEIDEAFAQIIHVLESRKDEILKEVHVHFEEKMRLSTATSGLVLSTCELIQDTISGCRAYTAGTMATSTSSPSVNLRVLHLLPTMQSRLQHLASEGWLADAGQLFLQEETSQLLQTKEEGEGEQKSKADKLKRILSSLYDVDDKDHDRSPVGDHLEKQQQKDPSNPSSSPAQCLMHEYLRLVCPSLKEAVQFHAQALSGIKDLLLRFGSLQCACSTKERDNKINFLRQSLARSRSPARREEEEEEEKERGKTSAAPPAAKRIQDTFFSILGEEGDRTPTLNRGDWSEGKDPRQMIHGLSNATATAALHQPRSSSPQTRHPTFNKSNVEKHHDLEVPLFLDEGPRSAGDSPQSLRQLLGVKRRQSTTGNAAQVVVPDRKRPRYEEQQASTTLYTTAVPVEKKVPQHRVSNNTSLANRAEIFDMPPWQGGNKKKQAGEQGGSFAPKKVEGKDKKGMSPTYTLRI